MSSSSLARVQFIFVTPFTLWTAFGDITTDNKYLRAIAPTLKSNQPQQHL